MPSIKDLKKRITSVKNTQQTTKAMKMVSAAKLRRASDAILNQRPYARQLGRLIRVLAGLPNSTLDSPFFGREAAAGEGEEAPGKKVILVVVTSDRGLCGGFNATILKGAQRWIQENRGKYGSLELVYVGRKARDFLKKRYPAESGHYEEIGAKVTFEKARKLAGMLVSRYLAGEADEVKFVYNEFINAVSQRVVVEDFLPILPLEKAESAAETTDTTDYLVKPSSKEVMDELLAKNFTAQAFRIMLESQAGEHGARMSAMENATKNAGEMIRKLTLQYNKQRQAAITKELLEIISGSESQKVS